MVRCETDSEYVSSGRVICTLCKKVLSVGNGGHVMRHVKERCPKRRAASEPPPESVDHRDSLDEPAAKQKKLTDFAKRQFTKQQASKIADALAKHALVTGKSFNYVGGDAMKDLVIDIVNSTGNGNYGPEARSQIPHRQTIQKHSLILSEKLIARAYEELKPHVGQRVNLLVDHGKIVVNYLSMFASFLDDSFQLKLIPIAFIPCTDGKSGADTAKVMLERLKSFGWSEEEARSCSVTADGALMKLGDHFASYIRCVSHSISLLAERVVNPRDDHKVLLASNVLAQLAIARECLQHAQNVSSAIRNNYHICNEMSRLPALPNDTRWLNGLKCLNDVTELSSEIENLVSKLSQKGKTSMYWILDESKQVNSVLHVLKPLLIYCDIFQVIICFKVQ
ncbi:unnamed protein product [Caenorhabditis brenneri]